jgi:hypothetical protein
MEAEVGEILKKYGYKPVYDYILAKFKSDYAFLSELFQVKTVNTETKIKRERKTVKNTVEKPTASTIESNVVPVVAVVNKNVPDTPKPVVEQSSEKKSEKKPVVKKVINKPVEHDIIENEIREAPHLRSLALPYGQSDDVGSVVDEEAEDVEIEDEEEGDVVEEKSEEKTVEKAEEKKDVNPNIKPSKCKDASKGKLVDEIKAKNLENSNKGIKSHQHLTDENIRKWIVDEKLKINDICRMTGCYPQKVSKRVKELGLETPVPINQQVAIARKLGKA